MRIGVVLPQTELGGDVRELRAYATGAEALGYGHLIASAARAAGRDPGEIGIQARVHWRGNAADVAALVERWRELGAGYVAVNTMGAGLRGPAGHLSALAEVARALGRPGQG